MKRSTRAGTLLGTALGVALVTGSVAPPAFASLGGDAASVDADVAVMKGQKRATTPVSGYTVSEITLPSGTIVHEYVSAEGQVFAVTWTGPTVPNLQQALGAHFAEFTAAASVPHSGHHSFALRQPDFVMHSAGHMRAWSGQAYVPGLLPPNFSLGDIK
jgi:Protein of unknown function (DUF2844)